MYKIGISPISITSELAWWQAKHCAQICSDIGLRRANYLNNQMFLSYF